MKDSALASVALQRLLETGQVIELKYKKQRLCLHSAHLPQQSAQVCHSQETSPDLDHDLSLQEVHQAYDRVRGRQLGSAVFISDLATELQVGFEKLHEMDSQRGNRIRSRLPGRGSLADGDRRPTGGGDRTSRFQAASYPVLMGVRARNRKKFRRGTLVNSRHLALSLAGRGKPDDLSTD